MGRETGGVPGKEKRNFQSQVAVPRAAVKGQGEVRAESGLRLERGRVLNLGGGCTVDRGAGHGVTACERAVGVGWLSCWPRAKVQAGYPDPLGTAGHLLEARPPHSEGGRWASRGLCRNWAELVPQPAGPSPPKVTWQPESCGGPVLSLHPCRSYTLVAPSSFWKLPGF